MVKMFVTSNWIVEAFNVLKDFRLGLLCEIGTEDWFVLIRVQVSEGRAEMIYEDGNGQEHARQAIPYTDFALSEITLYACWDQEHWVIMLPGEY